MLFKVPCREAWWECYHTPCCPLVLVWNARI